MWLFWLLMFSFNETLNQITVFCPKWSFKELHYLVCPRLLEFRNDNIYIFIFTLSSILKTFWWRYTFQTHLLSRQGLFCRWALWTHWQFRRHKPQTGSWCSLWNYRLFQFFSGQTYNMMSPRSKCSITIKSARFIYFLFVFCNFWYI